MATYVITDLAIILKPEDDVAIAKRDIAAGTILEDAGTRIEVRQDIKRSKSELSGVGEEGFAPWIIGPVM